MAFSEIARMSFGRDWTLARPRERQRESVLRELQNRTCDVRRLLYILTAESDGGLMGREPAPAAGAQ